MGVVLQEAQMTGNSSTEFFGYHILWKSSMDYIHRFQGFVEMKAPVSSRVR